MKSYFAELSEILILVKNYADAYKLLIGYHTVFQSTNIIGRQFNRQPQLGGKLSNLCFLICSYSHALKANGPHPPLFLIWGNFGAKSSSTAGEKSRMNSFIIMRQLAPLICLFETYFKSRIIRLN